MNSSELDQWLGDFRSSASQNESPRMVKRGLTAPLRSLYHDTTLGGAAFRTKTRERNALDMMFWQAVWASFPMFVACTLWNKQGIAVRPLPQGILIQRRGGLFYQTAEWVALVTVSSPTPTKILWNFTTALDIEITKCWPRSIAETFVPSPDSQRREPPQPLWNYRTETLHPPRKPLLSVYTQTSVQKIKMDTYVPEYNQIFLYVYDFTFYFIIKL